jgi:hypothetical protein
VYFGYLTMEHYTHNRADPTCLDVGAVPLPVVSTKANQNGKLFYTVETVDSAAPGYNNGWEVTCAVCEGTMCVCVLV